MHSPGRGEGCQLARVSRANGSPQTDQTTKTRTQTKANTLTDKYTPLCVAAALARATVAHLAEALHERRADDLTRELASALLDAKLLADALAALAAAQEGGQ